MEIHQNRRLRWRELLIAEMSLRGVARHMIECVRVSMLLGQSRFLDDPRHHVHNHGLLTGYPGTVWVILLSVLLKKQKV